MTDSIPADWRNLPWPALRSVAASVSTEPVKNRADAVRAIEAADRSAPEVPVADEPAAPTWGEWPAAIDIPADWHEIMTVAEILTLASRISPDGGNPVEIIEAEVARRAATLD